LCAFLRRDHSIELFALEGIMKIDQSGIPPQAPCGSHDSDGYPITEVVPECGWHVDPFDSCLVQFGFGGSQFSP
jgi:hypothetical protein